MLLSSKLLDHKLASELEEVKPGINKAFTEVKGVVRPEWPAEGTTIASDFIKATGQLPKIAGGAAPSYKELYDNLLHTKRGKYGNSTRDPSCINAVAFECEGKGPGKAIRQKRRDISVDVDSSFDSEGTGKTRCGAWAVIAECSSGDHHFAKKLYCGKEWCEVCGADKSAAHKRRQARLLPKVQQVKHLGYLVIEFPDWARHIGQRGIYPDLDCEELVAGWCYSKANLRETTNTIINVLAGESKGRHGRVGGYFKRGLARWHWFGDKCQGKFNPHLNILVDSGYMPKPLLEKIKADLRGALNCPDLIVHYSFCEKPGQMFQKVKYITRATFRDYAWNPYMARELHNFRNMRWWGSWKGEPAWELGQAEAEGEDLAGLEVVSTLQKGTCPDCGQPLRVLYHNHQGKPVLWSRAIDAVYLDIWTAKEISGTGYFRIPDVENNSYIFSPAELLRLDQIEAKARGSPSVHPFAVLIRKSRDELWRMTRTYKALERMKRRRFDKPRCEY